MENLSSMCVNTFGMQLRPQRYQTASLSRRNPINQSGAVSLGSFGTSTPRDVLLFDWQRFCKSILDVILHWKRKNRGERYYFYFCSCGSSSRSVSSGKYALYYECWRDNVEVHECVRERSQIPSELHLRHLSFSLARNYIFHSGRIYIHVWFIILPLLLLELSLWYNAGWMGFQILHIFFCNARRAPQVECKMRY